MDVADIPAVFRLVNREYRKRYAPIRDLESARRRTPFRVLVSTILSARTKDETTAEVSRRLFRLIRKPGDLRRFSQRELEKLILPIGFFRTKAKHLRQLPDVLDREFGGRIPDTIEELCRLPGVGRKTANLVVSVAFDKPAICVDIHVHRISNRLGLVRTKTPHDTEMALRRILPVRYWKKWNHSFVSFGQTICRPTNPQCHTCPLTRFCDRVGVKKRLGTTPP
jgi:endonuclease III